jgi:hypothetical protein
MAVKDFLQNELSTIVSSKLKEISKLKFSQFSGIDNIEIVEDKLNDMKFDHWICYILIATPGLKIGFRCHFTTKLARDLSEKFLGDASDLSDEVCHTFLGEYCNLVGGDLKDRLAKELKKLVEDPDTKLGLPEQSPVNQSLQDSDMKDQRKYMWQLKWDGGDVVCASTLHVDEEKVKENLGDDYKKIIKSMQGIKIDEKGSFESLNIK